ncbi:hypothetical protein Nepgr_032197 [Nepenthes gracilis]|uniref:Uncharacterized protein n=1 Tax=Nepenthes gracilis TaxID=150966 RepID=A0AAD3TJI6_NEPGR|nr:hypothetical protein Nepgr_032197 [Nepenthes gracilis]
MIDAIQILVDAKTTRPYITSLFSEGRQAVCGLLDNCLQVEIDDVPIFADSGKRAWRHSGGTSHSDDIVSEESNHREVAQLESATSQLKPSDRKERGDRPYLAQEVVDQVTAPSQSEQARSLKQSTSRKHLKSILKKPKGAKV